MEETKQANDLLLNKLQQLKMQPKPWSQAHTNQIKRCEDELQTLLARRLTINHIISQGIGI